MLAALAILATGTEAAAQQRDLNVRRGAPVRVSDAREDAAAGLERRLGPQATVSFDDTSGGVHMVARTNGTLTPPSKGEPADIALDYVRDHREVFGLDDQDVVRSDSPPGTATSPASPTSRGSRPPAASRPTTPT